MHSGYFRALKRGADFYNGGDVKPSCAQKFVADDRAIGKGCWPKPGVAENVNRDELANLGLNEQEVDDMVAFMNTATDG